MRHAWTLFPLALALGASSAVAASGSLCQPAEKRIFDCAIGDKRLSVCGSGNLGPKAGTVQYRFGSVDKPELLYPPRPAAPKGVFWSSHTMYSGGGEFRIRFRNGSHEFLVFDSSTRTGFGATGNKTVFTSGVVVKQNGKTLAVRKCTGDAFLDSELLDFLPEEDFDYDARP